MYIYIYIIPTQDTVSPYNRGGQKFDRGCVLMSIKMYLLPHDDRYLLNRQYFLDQPTSAKIKMATLRY